MMTQNIDLANEAAVLMIVVPVVTLNDASDGPRKPCCMDTMLCFLISWLLEDSDGNEWDCNLRFSTITEVRSFPCDSIINHF